MFARISFQIKRKLKGLYYLLSSLIKDLLFLVEIFLFLRLLLKFFSANKKAMVVKIVFDYSDVLIFPFKNIFPDIYWKKNPVEISTICAMLGYAIFVFLIFKIIDPIFKK